MRKKNVAFLFILTALSPLFGISQVDLNKGLIAYYPFNGNANDASGNGNNGIPMNGAQLTTDRFGNPNGAYLFDGIDDYIIVNDNGKLSPTSVTVTAFVNTETNLSQAITGKIDYITGNGAAYLLGINNNVQANFFFGVNPSGSTCSTKDPNNPNNPLALSSDAVSTNTWHCIVGTFSNSVLQIYVDGILSGTLTYPPTVDLLQCSNTELLIGSWWVGVPMPFKGKIDDVRIYDRVLNQQEVSALCSLTNCAALTGSLIGSTICSGDPQGQLIFNSPDSTGPFTLSYTDGINTVTQTNVRDSVSFPVTVASGATTVYTLLSVYDTTNCPLTLTGGPSYIATIAVEKPIVTATPDTTICRAMPVSLHAGGALTYSWSPTTALSDKSVSNPIATPTVTTSYVVTGTSVNGCIAKDSVLVTVFPNTAVIVTPDTNICMGDPAQLQAKGGITYSWSPAQYLDDPGIASPVARPITTTRFFLAATDVNRCNETDSISISIRPVPVFQSPPNNVILCEGYAVMLGNKGEAKYVSAWSPAISLNDPSSATPVASPVTTTVYTLRISDSVCNQYDSTFSVSVNVKPNPIVVVKKANDIDCSTATSQLTAIGAFTYAWSPAEGLSDPNNASPLASIDSTTTFIVKGSDINGCFAFDTITVHVTSAGKNLFIVPNAFTPNGDGRNDCFGIQRWGDVTVEEFSVFNRWGERIFTTHNPSDCWDGNFRGKPQEAGPYPYVIKARSFCGEITRTGLVMLVR